MRALALIKQADAISRNYQQGNLSQESLDKLRANGALRPEKRYINGIAKATKNVMHNVGWETYVEKNRPKLQKIVDSNPNLNSINDLRNDPVHRMASYKYMPKIRRINNRFDEMEAKAYGGYFTRLHDMGKTNDRSIINAINPNNKSSQELHEMSLMHNPNGNINQKKLNDRLGLYHEALESKYGNKLIFDGYKSANKQKDRMAASGKDEPIKLNGLGGHMVRELTPEEIEILKNMPNNAVMAMPNKGKHYVAVGAHASPKVLMEEANQISHIPYPKTTSYFKNVRHGTGEKAFFENHLGKDIYTKGTSSGDYNKLMKSINKNDGSFNVESPVETPDKEHFLQKDTFMKVPNPNRMSNVYNDIPNLPKINPQPQALNTVRPQPVTPQQQVAAALTQPKRRLGTLRSLASKAKSLFRR